MQYVDDLQRTLLRCTRQATRDQRNAWRSLQQRLSRVKPSLILPQRRQAVDDLRRRLIEQAQQGLHAAQNAWRSLEARLRLLSPDNVLARGYSITVDASTGRVVRGAGEVRAGQRIKTRLQTGEINSTVEP